MASFTNEDTAKFFYQMALKYRHQGQLAKAEDFYKKALTIKENFPECYNDLALLYKEKGWFDEAKKCYYKAITIAPDYSDCMYNLANLHADIGEDEMAEKLLKKALSIVPKAIYYNSLGVLYQSQGAFEKAADCYQKAIKIKPDYHACLNNLALVKLTLGDYETGLACYEHRSAIVNLQSKNINLPIWQGEDLNNKRIVVITEQGCGDNIQFIRFAKNLKKMGAYVIVHCQEALATLMQTCPWVDDVQPTLKGFTEDFYIFSGSLMHRVQINLKSIPIDVPYLFADKDKTASFKQTLFNHQKLKIGIVTKGSDKHINDGNRSIDLGLFKPIFSMENIQFYCLNFPSKGKKMDGKLIDVAPYIKDFSDTAAIIENLDLLISVDTAAAHLAGAMNKPCWLLIPKIADWRWLLEGETSLWYKSLHLFRQQTAKDWTQVIKALSMSLKEMPKISN